MNEDIEVFMDESGCFLEALMKSRRHVENTVLSTQLDKLIGLEIELAIMGAEKAKSEILKKNKDNVLRPIK